MREKIKLNKGWKFHEGDFDKIEFKAKGPVYTQSKTERVKAGPACYYYDDESDAFYYDKGPINPDYWETVDLPHDYIIEQEPDKCNNNTLGYYDYKNAWYRKKFCLEKEDENRRITLYFEGVAGQSTIYVNGCLMYRNFCGYTSFEVDITDVAFFDKENVVAVYTDVSSHEGWWYEGGGIYRNVWLIKTDRVAVDLWGVYACPKLDNGVWTVDVETTVINSDTRKRPVNIRTAIIDADGRKTAVAEDIAVVTEEKDKTVIMQHILVKNPVLWDIDNPYLYSVETSILCGGEEIDRVYTKFGFRTINFDAEKGFFLNGRNVKIKGVCCHQDYGLTGKAVADNIYRYRIQLLKEMGANGYRTAHYPHAEATMDALDEMGFLVMDETRWFESTPEGKKQLEMLIKRDRNHPSVILWSVGNEEPFHLTEQGRRITESLKAVVKKLDASRPVTTAVSNDPLNARVMDIVDVIGVNYNLADYDKIHQMYPKVPFVSSECCATGTTRGWYQENSKNRGYISAYDHDTDRWFLGRERTWKFIMEREWVSGCFQWAGIEHRGETVWPRMCSQSGALDLFLQKKDAFYQNKSHWTDEPMVHILPHWNHSGHEGEIIDVWAYTNCDELELFLNGKSLGKKKIEKYGHGEWRVEYKPGKLEVIGKTGGKAVASDMVETTGRPVALKLSLQNSVEYANGEDIAVVNCMCVDSEGRIVPDASPFVYFDSNGCGEIIGTGSDVSDHIPVNCPDRKMRAGLCAVAVKVGTKAGVLKVFASADGLKTGRIDINLK